jgi:hypothetical protein
LARRVVVADEKPKTRVLARASCTVVRYYVAKYTLAAAEAWARSKGATEAEIERVQHLKVPLDRAVLKIFSIHNW